MLEYNGVDISERIFFAFVHQLPLLAGSFSRVILDFQIVCKVCNTYHNMTQKVSTINDFVVVTVNIHDHKINLSQSETVDRIKIANVKL